MKSCDLSWTHPPLRHRSLGNTASLILLQHRGTTAAVAVSGLTRPMSEKAGRVPEPVLWSVHSVCRQGWNEPPHLQMSQYGHLWLSKLFRLLLQLSSTFFWGMVHLTNVWNRPKESHVRSTYLSLLLFWVCFLEERVGGRSRLLPTLLHICKRLALTEPMRTLLQAEDRTQPMTTLPTAVDC